MSSSLPPPKKIVVCLDGTNDEIGKSQPTNVGKTYEMLRLRDPSHQIAYYDPGVGTMPSPQAHGTLEKDASIVTELALGHGMRAKVAEAYTWLMQHYQSGDEIYVFGFSRGAFTARALVGMLNRPGLLRPGSENLVPYAVEEYTNRRQYNDATADAGLEEFSDAFCWGTKTDPLSPEWADAPNHRNWHAVPIKYVGIWDTVEAAGLLGIGTLQWQSTRELHNAEKIRHAVSIDEWRRPYHDYLVHPHVPGPGDRAEQVWFAGVHSDIGGTYPKDSRLARIALKWVIDGVIEQLPLREADSYARQCTMNGDEYEGEVHDFGFEWRLAGTHRRHIPDGASFHETVKLKLAWNKDYHLRAPANFRYVDPDWGALIPQGRLILPPP